MKLSLNKETISRLDNEKMENVYGGATWTLIACKPKTQQATVCVTNPNASCGCSNSPDCQSAGTLCGCFETNLSACPCQH